MALKLLLAVSLWSTWHTSAVTNVRGTPAFAVDGRPYYVYAAAFFYERTPRDEWRADLERYKALGINTIDLYLIWNWHEPDARTVDFDGHTNPRRDLRTLFSLIHSLGLKAIVRPGPVIRNEWRNGGYPDWLLRRPEYNMPLHDILEGRYPATATYQNAHADAAADEWLHNPVHLKYAAAWLHDVLTAIEPWSHDVIAIALDDDQGAYIDNDTWPAPHWHAYMDWLKARVQSTVGTRVPLFINTFQMKVTSSAPVWAWGNWYQSDAYRIGNHDLSQLMFSTALLQTQPNLPVMTSEFQAGWLQGADEMAPRPAAPENTTLALHEMLQLGVRGVVNFPLQDTLDPAGYEAPWANWFYAWDAAFTLQGDPSARAAPIAAFGSLVTRAGPLLATLTPRADVAIAWLGDAYDPSVMTNERFGALATATIAEQQRCRALALTCRFVDLRATPLAELRKTRVLVLPAFDRSLAFLPEVGRTLASLRRTSKILTSVDRARRFARSSTGGIRDAALLVSPDAHAAVLDIFNAGNAPRLIPATRIAFGRKTYAVGPLVIGAGDARDVFLGTPTTYRMNVLPTPVPTHADDVPITATAFVPSPNAFAAVAPSTARASFDDAYRDGMQTFVLDNGRVRVIVSADAGARVFVFEDLATGRNAANPIGLLRDDVATPSSPSPRDYIAAYTHPMRAGTFNRPYACRVEANGSRAALLCTYDAPDLAPRPVHFEKEFILEPNATSFRVRLRCSVDAVSVSGTYATPYAAGKDEWITFPIQGPPLPSANGGRSP
ncbi:MAG TPA: beta-galactosidase [Candidatus Baltobacteraceae bacterium]|nr:beta-galactosidase [Candidatus Baltobacteraceae bacterium]